MEEFPLQAELAFVPTAEGELIHTAFLPARGEFNDVIVLRFTDGAGEHTFLAMEPQGLLNAAMHLTLLISKALEDRAI